MAYSFGGAFSIGTSQRSNNQSPNKNNPGPGTYRCEDVTVNSSRSPRAVIFKSQRSPMFFDHKTPSPTQYSFSSYIGTGPQVTMSKSSYKDQNTKFAVGPSSYVVEHQYYTVKQPPKYSFSSKYDDLKPKLDVPGPGSYEIPSSIRKVKLNKYKSLQNLDEESPVSFASRTSLKQQQQQQQDEHSSSQESATLPNRLNRSNLTPGPGDYDITDAATAKHVGMTFSRSPRMRTKPIDSPGPGYFEIMTGGVGSSGEEKHFTLGAKLSSKEQLNPLVPGPGAYNVRPKASSPKITIGSSQRSALVINDTPGPGEYVVTSLNEGMDENYYTNSSPRDRGMGLSLRPEIVKGDNLPGPGRYKLPDYFGKSTNVKISQATSYNRFKSYTNTPGPGSYEVPSSIEKHRGIRISSKSERSPPKRDGSPIVVPGPGSYEQQTQLLKAGPAYSFPGDTRLKADEFHIGSQPHPGSYEIAGTFANVPAYLMSKKG